MKRFLSKVVSAAVLLSMCSFNSIIPVSASTVTTQSSVIYGDVNGDGRVNVLDYLLLTQLSQMNLKAKALKFNK